MKQLWIDTETTGLDTNVHCVHQIAALVVIDGKDEGTFVMEFAPHPDCDVSPDLVNLNPELTEENLRSREMTFRQAFEDMRSILDRHISKYDKTDKFFMFGYNARFDYDFLRSMFERMGDKYFGSYVWFPPIDVMNLAAHNLQELRSGMMNFKQNTVASALGIAVDTSRLHDALYDIDLCRQIYRRLQ